MRTNVTRTIRFRASHRYWKPEWSEAENRARFGKIIHSHFHDYTCAVTVSGPLDPETAMVMDLARLDAILEEQVRTRLEGKSLDRDLPEFAEGKLLPTCEAIAQDIFARVLTRLPSGVQLVSVRVTESDSLSATVNGER